MRFRKAIESERPLQVVGAVNANHALLAKQSGFLAIYLSGGGVAAGSLGVPDLGITNLEDILVDVRRITDVCDLPLLVDADTGFGVSALSIARTTKSLIKSGAAAMQMEDQAGAKRCGHRPNKEVVATEEMTDRLKSAADARPDQSFAIMARTDSLAIEGLDRAIERSVAYVEAGADMIFAEAVTDLSMYRRFADATKVPILANMTEFGVTPLATTQELAKFGVGLVLYPLSAFRAMNKAADRVYSAIRRDGTQANVLNSMQTREELYESINYHAIENQLDSARAKESKIPGLQRIKDK
jgi:methylisocitrate lyase